MAIKIYADAGSNLFKQVLENRNADIKVINMHLTVGDHEYNCYDDPIDVEDFSKIFYKYLEDPNIDVHTTLINPNDYLALFEKEVAEGNQVICFTMAKGISGTYNSAVVAAQEVNAAAGKEMVHIINTATAGLGEGRQALKAYELVQQGKSFEQIIEFANQYRWRVRSEFTVDSVSFLARTGRVSALVGKVADALRIKAMLKGSNQSNIVSDGNVHGRKMALKTLATKCLKKIVKPENQIVYITHCNCLEDAESVKRMLAEGGVTNVEIYHYDFVTGSHVGPGTVAIFYEGLNRD